jgi:putative membrane-bound dehydrogenase-like protein
MRRLILVILALFSISATAETKPLKALLVAGGCCHDYAKQQDIISKGIMARAKVRVDVVWTDDKSTNPPLPLYDNPNWAESYDIIIHDECAADSKDPAILDRVLAPHQKIPAVHLHCAMHSFRIGNDRWFKHLGLQSNSHGPQEPIAISFVDKDHPVAQQLADWTTIKEELYNNVTMHDAHPLAMGKQMVKGKEASAVVAWTNEKQGARSFSTTLGHNNNTVADGRYLDMLTRGLLWACDKLNADYLGQAYTGSNKVTFVPGKPKEAPKPKAAPANSSLIKASATSEETGKHNYAWKAADGDEGTRWCAADPTLPQSLQLELETPAKTSAVSLKWESKNGRYTHQVEGSMDGKTWSSIGSAEEKGDVTHPLEKKTEVKFLKITVTKTHGGWASIREVQLQGEGIQALAPKREAQEMAADLFKDGGNTTPKATQLSAEAEAALLKDVKVPEGFEARIFAAAPMVNYPVYVAAAPDGTLYVSSDGNGSLGRKAGRGRILRLRDANGDGRADEVKEFVKDIDSPRGLLWDRDRLYLVHPPHLSAFIDKDGDGISDEQKILVKDIAFGFKDRPADHTTNGLSIGMDGWLYIAGGDFGFLNAEGTDGTRLTHRGGGVIRVRPDGTGLQIYSTGTRNILEVAISPTMEMFARDNTNDGGGWNVRFHHFTGGADHGYPRLYKNFAEECITPLADYGGGSGCGAVYIDEPGFGEWNNAPFTCDWGSGAVWHHKVEAKGATFVETRAPVPFIKMTRPTDADVDAQSRVYAASWKGPATFDWAGPEMGYIACVWPKGHKPSPVPDLARLTKEDLQSPSYRIRLEAARKLDLKSVPVGSTKERRLVHEIQNGASDDTVVTALSHPDPVVAHVASRVAAKRDLADQVFSLVDQAAGEKIHGYRALAMMHSSAVVEGLLKRLAKPDLSPEQKRGVISTLCRLHFQEGEWKRDASGSIASWGTRPDTRGPYYQPEAWSETPRIAKALKDALASATAEDAQHLISELTRNRIQFDEALSRVLALAKSDPKALPDAMVQLASAESISSDALPLVLQALQNSDSASMVSNAVLVAVKSDSAEAWSAAVKALPVLREIPNGGKEAETALNSLLNAPKLENHHQLVEGIAEKLDGKTSLYADVALLALAARSSGSPEAKLLSRKALDTGWAEPKRRIQILAAIQQNGSRLYDDQVLAALNDADAEVKKAAKGAAGRLRLKPRAADTTPKIGSLAPDAAIAAVLSHKEGDVGLGEQLFTKATCIACHTVKESDPPKGPYLGNIAQTYQRPDLAWNILDPNRTIAQGFASEAITLKDGSMHLGFITLESAAEVKLRNIAAQEFTFKTADITKRDKLPISIMPPGLMAGFSVHEFASLLNYLEALAKKH